jgi:rod shape-determining protein MreD
MRAFWATALAILAALLVQTALGRLLPMQARVFDPFLLVVVYCGLTGGEVHGMLAGAAAGWVQDVHFGVRIEGLAGLSKVLVGFGVGVGSTRFHLGEPAARLLVLMVATIVDALLFGQLAQVFDVQAYELSPLGLIARAVVNGAVGMVVFETVDRQRRRWALHR